MKITDNMVELAAMALANADREAGELDRWEHPPTPESASEAWRDMHRRRARTALTAALADLDANMVEAAATRTDCGGRGYHVIDRHAVCEDCGVNLQTDIAKRRRRQR